ncbi:MAG: DUF167 domain-containing protein [Gemmataceae bacterium]|nr:DUF167 domain-containing protein [Gemmataceae bacterium]
MIDLQETAQGVVLSVRAQPGARKNAVTGEYNQALNLSVTAAPEDGKANEAITQLLRESLGLKRSQVALVSGATSRDKKFLFTGMGLEELRSRVEALLS